MDLRTFIVSVIMLSFTSYLILLAINNIVRIIRYGLDNYSFKNIYFFESLFIENTTVKLTEVFSTVIIAILLGVLISNVINKGHFYKLFRDVIHITNKTGNDVWNDVFDNNTKSINKYVYVVDKKYDIVYGGWLNNYSSDPDNKELHLTNVVVTKDSERKTLLRKIEELYITYDKSNMSIEIDSGNSSNNKGDSQDKNNSSNDNNSYFKLKTDNTDIEVKLDERSKKNGS